MNPWDPLPDETPRARTAFRAYLDQGQIRTARQAWAMYKQLIGSEAVSPEPPGYFTAWSVKHNWVERASLYDQHMREIEMETRETTLRERTAQTTEFEWEMSQALLDKAQQILRLPLTRQTVTRQITTPNGDTVDQTVIIEPINFRLNDALRAVEISSKLARRAVGLDLDSNALNITQDEPLYGIDILPPADPYPDDDNELPN